MANWNKKGPFRGSSEQERFTNEDSQLKSAAGCQSI